MIVEPAGDFYVRQWSVKERRTYMEQYKKLEKVGREGEALASLLLVLVCKKERQSCLCDYRSYRTTPSS